MENSGDITQFLGRFHLLLLHLPIGLLALLAFLELISLHRRCRQATSANRFILILLAPTTVLTAGCGWLLAWGGGYEDQLLFLHRWTGAGVAVATCLLLWVHYRGWLSLYRVLMLATVGLAVVTGHFGGSLTHGSGFLTRHAPGWIGGQPDGRDISLGENSGFAIVEPILSEYCVACHGAEKAKGGLRTDSLGHLLSGGDSGPAVVAGDADGSLLLQRLRLPLTDVDRMPPEGKPQPAQDEVELIRNWILSGAFE